MSGQEEKVPKGLAALEVQVSLQGKGNHLETSRHPDTSCGIGSCKPSGLQCCASIAIFTGATGITSLFLQTLSTYIASQVTSLEKQFGLSSTDSGFLVSCNDIGFLSTVLIFSHFGRKGYIPRILGLNAVIYGIGGVVCSLSQFIEPASLPKVGTDGNSTSRDGDNYLCSPEETTKSPNDTCKMDESRGSGSSQWVMYVLAIALVVQGICKSPRTPLATVYIDNNVSDKKSTGLFLGVLTTLTLFGPALAFVLGGMFSRIPVDLQDTLLSPVDTRWIGAWWLGFLIFGSISVVVAAPLFFFPKRLKGSWTETQKGLEDRQGTLTLWEKIKGLPTSVLRVLRSPVYTLTLCGVTFVYFFVGGYVSFGPKYMENVFLIPAWQANVIQGIQAGISIGLGTFFGGYLTTRFKLTPRSCLKFIVIAGTIALCLQGLNFIFGCQHPSIIGMESSTPLAVESFNGCECKDVQFLPVCGVNTQRTYFSPCHAGCRYQNETIYSDCISEAGSDVTLGICDNGCHYLYPFAATTLGHGLVGTLTIIPSYIILLRSVQEEDKSMAIGILTFSMSLLGFVPAPIVYGKVIDTTCRLWNFSCGTRGSCALYDIVDLRRKMVGMNFGVQAGAATMFLVAFLVRKFVLKADQKDVPSDDTTDTKLYDCISEAGSDVTLGICDNGCHYLYPFAATTLGHGLVGTLTIIPSYIILLRSVQEEDKSMAIGILTFSMSLLGFVPAPIVYGKVIDTTCRLWNFSCGTRGSCALYDIVDLRRKMVGMNFGVQAGAATMFLVAFLVRKFVLKADQKDVPSDDTTDTKL